MSMPIPDLPMNEDPLYAHSRRGRAPSVMAGYNEGEIPDAKPLPESPIVVFVLRIFASIYRDYVLWPKRIKPSATMTNQVGREVLYGGGGIVSFLIFPTRCIS